MIYQIILNSHMKLTYFLLFIFFLNESAASDNAFKKIQWSELMPAEDAKILYEEPPEELLNIPEGGIGDEVSDEVFSTLMLAMDNDYQQALSSTNVIAALDNKKIQIPGFIVPVVMKEDKTTEFFIVPYFGACMHYPPPPPNQTIYASYINGYSIDTIYEPVSYTHLTLPTTPYV